MRTAGPTPRRLAWLPTSRAGSSALAFFGVSVTAVLFMGATAAVQRPETFDKDLLLAVPAALAAGCGMMSTVFGAWALICHERAALLLLLTLAADLNIVSYVLGEAVRRT